MTQALPSIRGAALYQSTRFADCEPRIARASSGS